MGDKFTKEQIKSLQMSKNEGLYLREKGRKIMKNKGCKTCKEIEEIDFCNKSFIDSNGELTEVLKVQLVIKIYDKKGKQSGHMGYRARKINFCPECGKKIEENKKKWKM